MWQRIKDIAKFADGIAYIPIFFAVLVGAKFLNDMLEAPTYTLSVFNCHTKPCKWVEYPNQFHKRTECENAGKHTVDDIDEVKDYRCEE